MCFKGLLSLFPRYFAELGFCDEGFTPCAYCSDTEIAVELLGGVVEDLVFWEEDCSSALGDSRKVVVQLSGGRCHVRHDDGVTAQE